MADDIRYLVGADLSPFDEALAAVPAKAAEAAAQIDQALSSIGGSASGATAGLQTLNDALAALWEGENVTGARELNDAVQGLGAAASAATEPLTEFDLRMKDIAMDFEQQKAALEEAQTNLQLVQAAYDKGAASAGQLADAEKQLTAAQQAITPAIQETESAFSQFTSSIVATLEKLGLMIGIFEALKQSIEEFATEQAFEISMTELTGSADKARGALEQLKAMALQLPVALDSMLAAAQKMEALGVSLEQIPDLLKASADAAAATGNSFDSISSALERVMATGQVMTRSLVQMGLTWDQVAQEMGTSIEKAQAAFKKGAQSAQEDVDILVATIEKFHSTAAEALAGSLAGSFQILKNQLSELAASFGSVLAPVAGLLMSALQGIIPILNAVVELFKALEFAIGAIAVPLGAILSAMGGFATMLESAAIAVGLLGIAFEALSVTAGVWITILGAAAMLIQALTDHTSALREEQERAKAVQEGWSKAVKDAQDELTQYGIKLKQGNDSLLDFQTRILNTAQGLNDITNNFLHAGDSMEHFKSIMANLAEQFPQVAAQLAALGLAAEALAKQGPNAAAALIQLGATAQALVASQIAASTATSNFSKALDDAKAKVHEAQVTYDEYLAAFKRTGEGAGLVEAAHKKLSQAQEELNGHVAKGTDALKAYNAQITVVNAAIEAYNKALEKLPASFTDYVATLDNGGKKAAAALKSITDEINKNAAAMVNLSGKPKEALEQINADLEEARKTWQEFANLDALDKFGAKIAEIADKHTAAVDRMDADTQRWIASMRAFGQAADDVGAASVRAFEAMLVSSDKLAESTDKLQKTFEKAYESMYKGTQKQIEITGTLSDRLNGIDKLHHQVAASADTIVAAYFKMVAGMNAFGLQTQQQMETAISGAQHVLDLMVQMNQPVALRMSMEEKILNMQIAESQAIGASGTATLALTERLAAVKQKHQEIIDKTMELSDAYNSMLKSFDKAWADLGKGIADAIVEGQNFGDVLKNVLKTLAKEILEQVIGVAFKELKHAFLDNTDALGTFTKGFNSFFGVDGAFGAGMKQASGALGAFGAQATESMGTAGNAFKDFSSTTQSTMQQTQASVLSAGSSMIATFDLIASVLGAIAGIFSAIELAHTNTLLGRIEESTRRMDITMEGIVVKQLMYLTKLDDITSLLWQIMPDIHNMGADINSIPIVMGALLTQIGAMASASLGNSTMNPILIQLLNQLNQLIGSGSGIGGGFSQLPGGIGQPHGTERNDFPGAVQQFSAASLALMPTVDTLSSAASDLGTAAQATTAAAAATTTAANAAATAATTANKAAETTASAAASISDAATAITTGIRGETQGRRPTQTMFDIGDQTGTIIYQFATALGDASKAIVGVTQAAQQFSAVTAEIIHSTTGVMAAAVLPTSPTLSPGILSAPGVGQLNAAGQYTGAPVGTAGPYVSGGPTIYVTVSAGVVAGQGAMQQLGDMVGQRVVQNLRTSVGLKL
jgi:chromosome segregation ATPase